MADRMGLMGAVALLGAAASLTGCAAERTPAATRIAVCDVVGIFNNYQRAKDLTVKLQDAQAEVQAEGGRKQKKIDALAKELGSYKAGSDEHKRATKELTRRITERDKFLGEQQALRRREHRRLTNELYVEILTAVAKVAAERGAAVAVQREREQVDTGDTDEMLQQIYNRKVLYIAEPLDITDAVLHRLNREYRQHRAAMAEAPVTAPAADGGCPYVVLAVAAKQDLEPIRPFDCTVLRFVPLRVHRLAPFSVTVPQNATRLARRGRQS